MPCHHISQGPSLEALTNACALIAYAACSLSAFVGGLIAACMLTECVSGVYLQGPPACRVRPYVGSMDGTLRAESLTEQAAASWKPWQQALPAACV